MKIRAGELADARDERRALEARPLAREAIRVLDRDRGVAGEARERVDVACGERAPTSRAGARCAPEPEHADDRVAPADGHAEHGVVGAPGAVGAREIAIATRLNGRSCREHRAGEADAARDLEPQLVAPHVVRGLGADGAARVVHEADGALVSAEQLARLDEDAREEWTQLGLATDRLEQRLEALALAPRAITAARRGHSMSPFIPSCMSCPACSSPQIIFGSLDVITFAWTIQPSGDS